MYTESCHFHCYFQDTPIVRTGKYVRSATYKPSLERQAETQNSDGGLAGEFLVNYDVKHELDAGLVFTDEGYFVHYFAPSGLQVLAKNVVFVIDISGSMSGSKLHHTKKALLSILDELRPFDYFEIILFSDQVTYWHRDRSLVLADKANVTEAKQFLDQHLTANGGTNINAALISACKMLAGIGQKGQNLIFFLTDGRPTTAVTDTNLIARNIQQHAASKSSIFSLGFGDNVNFELLKKISYETGGWAKVISTGRDSNSQMESVYKEVGPFNVSLCTIRVDSGFAASQWETSVIGWAQA